MFHNRYARSKVYSTVSEEVFQGLNKAQKDATLGSKSNFIRCVAGPGSGKTRVLTARINYLISSGAHPSTIMSVTFTKKAAEEMKKRLSNLVGEDTVKSLTVGTFHSVCTKFLRSVGSSCLSSLTNCDTVDDQFSIYDDSDSLKIIKNILLEMNSACKPRDISSIIQQLKESAVVTQEIISVSDDNNRNNKEKQSSLNLRIARQVLPEYNRQLYNANALDFQDLLVLCCRMLKEYPHVLESLRRRFKHVLVDEYQDTNLSQYEIIRLLAVDDTTSDTGNDDHRASSRRSLFVVGDKNQAIYSWRGAVPYNMDKLLTSFPKMSTYLLAENYRSTSTIVAVANAVIGQTVSVSLASTETVLPVKVVQVVDEETQARYIVKNLIDSPHKDIAVMYRRNQQSQVLERAMLKSKIKYRIVGGLRFYERAEIKCLMSYLRLLVNPYDLAAATYVINTPARNIGEKSQLSLFEWVKASARTANDRNAAVDRIDEGQRRWATRYVGASITDHLYSLLEPDIQFEPTAALVPPSSVSQGEVSSRQKQTQNSTTPQLQLQNQQKLEVLISPCPLNTQERKKIINFAKVMYSLEEKAKDVTLPNLVRYLITAIDMKSHVEKISEDVDNSADRQENVAQLVQACSVFYENFNVKDIADIEGDDGVDNDDGGDDSLIGEVEAMTSLRSFLDDAALADYEEELDNGEASGKVVSLMTIHAAKGLEFESVYVAGCEDANLPLPYRRDDEDESAYKKSEQEHIDEERRLAYVAITRAKTQLVLLWRQFVTVYGKTGKTEVKQSESRFLKALSPSLVTRAQVRSPANGPTSSSSSPSRRKY